MFMHAKYSLGDLLLWKAQDIGSFILQVTFTLQYRHLNIVAFSEQCLEKEDLETGSAAVT